MNFVPFRRAAIAVLSVLFFVWLGIVLMNLFSTGSEGPFSGKLAACPQTPNCVATSGCLPEQQMEPWPMIGTTTETMNRIVGAIAKISRMKIVEQQADYLRAESTSLVFRFVDDVEFLVDSRSRLVHFRSASRIGKYDLGVNRNRILQIRRLYMGAENPGNGPN